VHVIENGRLGPGQMISVDLTTGDINKNDAIKRRVASRTNYADMLERSRHKAPPERFATSAALPAAELLQRQIAAGYGAEDVDFIIKEMATTGSEPVFSMGDDTALACLSSKPRILYDFFKQRFAQVTNPPIDHLRERMVMSLAVYLRSVADQIIKLDSPFLTEVQLQALMSSGAVFSSRRISLSFSAGNQSLSDALSRVVDSGIAAAKAGVRLLVLSDWECDRDNATVPPLLATGALHHRLIELGLRTHCSIIVESAQCWNVHHFACLLTYGAQAICPYLALDTIRSFYRSDDASTGETCIEAQRNYKHAVESGLFKVISKMGISTLSSYIGAQIVECIGLGAKVIAQCFE
ncbi:MAG: glutamate synthase central domain-containing protein, partial [Terriglobales bacterium]